MNATPKQNHSDLKELGDQVGGDNAAAFASFVEKYPEAFAGIPNLQILPATIPAPTTTTLAPARAPIVYTPPTPDPSEYHHIASHDNPHKAYCDQSYYSRPDVQHGQGPVKPLHSTWAPPKEKFLCPECVRIRDAYISAAERGMARYQMDWQMRNPGQNLPTQMAQAPWRALRE
jgi:hypothetical protein